MKKCSKCGVKKEFTEFHKDRTMRSGFISKCKACCKAYKEANKEKIKVRQSEYYKSNREKVSEKQGEYYKANKEKIKVKQRKYQNKRLNTDPLFKLSKNVKNRIRNSIKNRGYSKKTKTYDILGCSFEYLINHLNNNPYGFIYSDSDLDLDHIVPLSTASKELDIIKLNHYTNFQLLPSEYNRYVKRDNKWDRKDFECWLQNNRSFHL